MGAGGRGRGLARGLAGGLGALLVGALMVLLLTGEDLSSYSLRVPGYSNTDHTNAIYLHTQFHERIFAGQWPGFDPKQLFPVGTWLAGMHGNNSLELLLSAGLRYLVGWPAWFSWAHVAWIPLNALAFYPLGLHLWGRAAPALAAGAAWAALPLHLGEIASGRLTQVALIGLPIAVLGLLRLCEGDDRRAPWVAGLGLALTGLGYWFYGLFLVLLLPLFAGWGLRHRRAGPLLRDLAVAGAVAGLLVAPALLPVLWPRFTGGWAPSPPIDVATHRPLFENALQLDGNQPVQLRGWLPWVLVPGWLLSLRAGLRRPLWLALSGVCLIFALGPAQHLGGYDWILPYYPLWKYVPFLDRLTHPGRWLGVGGLFLVIAAADGLARGPARGALAIALPVGLVLQARILGNAPLGTWAPSTPGIWRMVAEDPTPGAIIVVPVLGSPGTAAMQPIHGRPLLGGMAEGLPWAWPPEFVDFVQQSPLLMGLADLSQGGQRAPPVYQQDLDRLRAAGFGLIVWDRLSWDGLRGRARVDPKVVLTEALGPPAFSDAGGVVWYLPERGIPGEAPVPTSRLPGHGP